MKKYFNYLKKHLSKLLIILFSCFLLSFFISDIYNKNESYYVANFTINDVDNFNTTLLNDKDFLETIKANGKDGKYDGTDVEKMLKHQGFTYYQEVNYISIKAKSKYFDTFFLSSINNVSSRCKMFIKDCVLTIADDKCEVIFLDENIVSLYNNINQWSISLISSFICLFLEITIFTILFLTKRNLKKDEIIIYDNITTFSSCFHINYWKKALKPINKVLDITILAMFFSLMIICKMIPLPSGFGNLGISFTYLFFSIISMIYGPVVGFIVGIFSDIIGHFFISNSAFAFNIGYTLQAALAGMIYGLFFYKTKVTFTKTLLARSIVNIVLNAIYGSFLYIYVMYFDSNSFDFNSYLEKVKYYMFYYSLPKNLIYLLPQSFLLYYVIKITSPILTRYKIIPKIKIVHHQ